MYSYVTQMNPQTPEFNLRMQIFNNSPTESTLRVNPVVGNVWSSIDELHVYDVKRGGTHIISML